MMTAKQKGWIIVSIVLLIFVLRFFEPIDGETMISGIDETIIDNDSNSITLEMIITGNMINKANGASFTTSRCKEFEVYIAIVGTNLNVTSEDREDCEEEETTHFISRGHVEEFEFKITAQFGEGTYVISLYHEAAYFSLDYWLYVYDTATADYAFFS